MKKILLVLLLCFAASNVFAEKVVLNTGRVVEGHIVEVTEEYVKMYLAADHEMVKLRFRNMDIDSAEKYRYYEPKPFDVPEIKQDIVTPKTYKDYAREGLDLAAAEKYEEAIDAFNEAIEIRNEIADFYLFRAQAYQALGKVDKAIKDYNTVIKRDPDNINAYARRGWVYQTKGEKFKAIDDYSRVLKLDPYNEEILFERYNLYKETEQWWKAKKDIDYIIAFDPEFGEPYIDQAILNYRTGSYYNAWRSVYDASKRGVSIPPDFISSLNEKMKDPFVPERTTERKKLDKIKDFLRENKSFLLFALVVGLIAVGIFLMPARVKSINPLKNSIEKEESALNMVVFKKAAIFRRACAGLIDFIVLSVVAWAIQIIVPIDVFCFALSALFLFRDGMGGESIGKSLMGLRVIDEHGYRGIFFQGFIRNFSFSLPLIIFYVAFWGKGFRFDISGRIFLIAMFVCFFIEWIAVLLSKKEGRRLGDRMAGTYVHDMHPDWWRWPFAVLMGLLFVGFILGSAALNMTFNKDFVYQLNPMRYYNIERQFSFKIPQGWKKMSEGEGGLVFEHKARQGTMALVLNKEAQHYSLEVCASAFTQSMEDGGLMLRTEEKIEVAGRKAYKKGFMDPATKLGFLVVYFKKEDSGELYIIQVTSVLKNMRHVMGDAAEILKSFRFE